jgi:hypothetical protein
MADDAATYRWFERLPPEPELSIWREWLRRHGVDPNDVAVSGGIERDEQNYWLIYTSFEWGPDGLPVIDPETRDVVTVDRVFQLEGPPLPFPD